MHNIIHYDDNGNIQAIQVDLTSKPLFTIQQCEEEKFEMNLLDGLKKWITNNTDLYKLPTDACLDMSNINLSNITTFVNKCISICRFEQTYRKLPVYGRSQYITLAVVNKRDVRKISGQIINEQESYHGLKNSISKLESLKLIKKYWVQHFPDTEVFVRDVQKVVIPEKKIIGFKGEICKRIFSSSRMIQGIVIIEAETGDLVLLNDFRAEATVRGLEMKDNPQTDARINFDNIPATQFGNTIHFENNPLLDCNPPTWLDFRMGNKTRYTILDFNGTDGNNTNQFTVGGCSSGAPPPRFLNNLLSDQNFRFIAQDLIVKINHALAAIDPLMGELITHGSSHSYSWNHHPDVPDIVHRSPLIFALNSTIDNPGEYISTWISEDDTKNLELPNPHPLTYVCRNANDEIVSCSDPNATKKEQYASIIYLKTKFPFWTRTLFHELGHYYDDFNTHGFLVDDLREIVPQLFSLYLHRKLYPDLIYTLSTMSEEACCNLQHLISHSAGLVVHPDCIDDLTDISQSIKLEGNGYTVKSFTQAYWSLLFGVSCSIENNSVVCVQPNNLPSDYEDRWMEALLFAMQMGNEQSLVEFWENMELFIESNYPDDLNLIQSARALHGLQ
ncbi:MAG: hypothetical protein OEL69_02175 [Nitrosopumilus sp.]|nr:hypothetical protein [Nitrosopumilus sp.]